VVVRALCKVVPLLEDVGIGPGEVGSARSSPHPAVIEANLKQADELVAAPGICTRERKVDEGGGAEAVVRVLGGPWRRWVLVAQDLVVEVAHHAENLLAAEVVAAVHVPRFRVPEIERQHAHEAGWVVAGGGGRSGRGPLGSGAAALEDSHAVFEMIRQEEAICLEAEVAKDVGVALQDRR